ENQKLMTGASPSVMVSVLEGLGVDALGVNCSLGPDKMLPVVKEIIENASIPVIVNPNAGLPVIKDGKTEFDIDAKSFAKSMEEIAKLGAGILGGCCGTTPEYIKKTRELVDKLEFLPIEEKNRTVVSSYNHTVEFGEKPILIGERINPTGKKILKEALRQKNYEYILKEGIGQEDAGADILDVNAGLPEIDEKEVLQDLVKLFQSVTSLPLQIDTSNADAMEASLRQYNGKALINSVNGKKESMKEIFPLAKKYGGAVICLTLDEDGIPETASGRIEIANKIIETAKEYGISQKDLIFDPLCMTISSDSASAIVTLECIKEFKKMGIKTSLGVSNVSFGLPKRNLINSTFFAMALATGLNAAIMNPYSSEMMDVYYSFCALSNLDERCENYINYASREDEKAEIKPQNTEVSDNDGLIRAVLKGLTDESQNYTKKLLETEEPLSVIDNCIIPALDEMGSKFEKGRAFLPQLLMSAEAAKVAFDVIKARMQDGGKSRDKKYKIVLATVKGDIHDIGKNIVKVLLENYDFDVIDLGKDVDAKVIVDTANR
ncbi:MAG: dihydropteroate synthase, partial [Clostridia bacterium]|nr:dihydropteroate synthase [Clostridia bacterium]